VSDVSGQNCCSFEGCSVAAFAAALVGGHAAPSQAPRPLGGQRNGHGTSVLLIDVDEEIKMLEEYQDALTVHLEKVNKRLDGLNR
jgi:hypothetical protein